MVELGVMFEVSVTDLFCNPFLPLLLKITFIELLSPGNIGNLGHSGTVHPHEPFALEIIRGVSPSFLKIKE